MILIENILDKSALAKIDQGTQRRLNEAIDQEVSEHKKSLEVEMAARFDGMVESISQKFDEQVDKTIVESVLDSRLGKDVNDKMVGVITGMIGILESSGLYNSEKTKELAAHLKLANQKVEEAYKEREVLKNQLEDSKKENYILERLMGMKPEIVSAALEYFKDKDIMDVTDEIDNFIDGDFSELQHDDSSDKFSDGLNDITLDNVEDALKDIQDDRTTEYAKKGGAKLESLGRGLKPQRAAEQGRMPYPLVESEEGSGDQDVDTALSQIGNMMDLGFNFTR